MYDSEEGSMDSFPERNSFPQEAALSPPRSSFGQGCGRLTVMSDGSGGSQHAQPLPAKTCQAHEHNHIGPELTVKMQGSHVSQAKSFELPVDDLACGQQLMLMQRQLAYMIAEQDKMQDMVGKVSVGMDALLAQQLAGASRDPPRDRSRRRSSRRSTGNSSTSVRPSCTVLPRQKQFFKEISDLREEQPTLPGEDSPVKTDGLRDGGRIFGSERSSRSGEIKHVCHDRRAPSRNHFADKRATENDDMCMLRELFLAAETADEEVETSFRRVSSLQYCRSVRRFMDREAAEVMLESTVGAVIVLNAICIGLSMDSSDEDKFAWIIVDSCFSFVFLLELSAKVGMNGFWFHFCGRQRCWRIFDASLIIIDLIQLLIATALHDAVQGVDAAPSASLFRTVRIGRLARMLRLLKSSVFNDLLAMLQGLWGALSTLGWAMVLFIVVVYFVALLFREFFGKADVPNVSESFSSVPRAMFTTFRCSFGDCSAPSGVPIFVHVADEYGVLSCLVYCLFVFVITIGLFNVISAIFVQTTLAAASALQVQKKKNRLRDYRLWCTNVAKLVRRLTAICNPMEEVAYNPDVKLTDALEEVYQLEVPCEDIDLLVQDPEAVSALTALDIVPEDRDYLSDILDPDSGGTINVIELVEGLRRLRGDPRRSDIVTVNLMIRSVQKDVSDIFGVLDKILACQHSKNSL